MAHSTEYGTTAGRCRRASRIMPRGALTLLELVMVLVILAVVATLAVQALQPRVDNARFETTRTALNEIRRATLGDAATRQVDGAPILQGFVADVGCLPRHGGSALDSGAVDPLHELWDATCTLARDYPYGFRSGPAEPIDLTDVRIACGWRGPYLALGVGARSASDAWGRPFETLTPAGEIERVTWHSPIDPETSLDLSLDQGRTTVAGNLVAETEVPPSIAVFLLTPDPRQSLDELRVAIDEDAQPSSFLFSGVPIGLRAVVVAAGDRRLTKFVYVPAGGAALAIDISDLVAPPDGDADKPALQDQKPVQ